MSTRHTRNDLRCFCSRKPLLATYGLTTQGKLYVHVKVYKQSRIYGEVLVTEGTVELHCRECLRWHKVVMHKPGAVTLEETEKNPSAVEV